MPFGAKYPPRTTYACFECGGEVRPTSTNVAREVTGWVAPRRGGGANHIRNQTPTGRFAHVACLPPAGKETFDQQELF